jgi:hypothetical protein
VVESAFVEGVGVMVVESITGGSVVGGRLGEADVFDEASEPFKIPTILGIKSLNTSWVCSPAGMSASFA